VFRSNFSFYALPSPAECICQYADRPDKNNGRVGPERTRQPFVCGVRITKATHSPVDTLWRRRSNDELVRVGSMKIGEFAVSHATAHVGTPILQRDDLSASATILTANLALQALPWLRSPCTLRAVRWPIAQGVPTVRAQRAPCVSLMRQLLHRVRGNAPLLFPESAPSHLAQHQDLPTLSAARCGGPSKQNCSCRVALSKRVV